ncbi:MAG: class I SAM-dependent methyltransferase [Bacteroidota bacterium]|nr:class I SAM-dependent methyltransferase [Bacteroidota bacterium]
MAIYDNASNTYDQWYNKPMGKFVDDIQTKKILEMFPFKKGITVLDVGCGTGNYSIKLASMGCDVVGIDVSDNMLKIAQQKAKKQNLDINFINMDILKHTLKKESFDVVVSVTAFEFISNIAEAYKQIKKLVKPEGHILVGTIHKESPWGELYASEYFQKNSIFAYANLKTVNDLENLDKTSLIKIEETLFTPPNTQPEELNTNTEKYYATQNRGGFICALWKK